MLGIAIGAATGGLIVWLAERRLRDAFAALSDEALRQNNQSFLDLAQTKLGAFQQSASFDLEKRQKAVDDLVRPIQDALVRVDGTLQQVERDRIANYSGPDGAGEGNGADPAGASGGDGKPGQGAPGTAGAGTLGRDPAPPISTPPTATATMARARLC